MSRLRKCDICGKTVVMENADSSGDDMEPINELDVQDACEDCHEVWGGDRGLSLMYYTKVEDIRIKYLELLKRAVEKEK